MSDQPPISGSDGDEPEDQEQSNIMPITIEDEMKVSYLDYAMSVIVSRALPDVRDGLKPVHRRILYAMHESGYEFGKPYRKSARIVGDVMGKYHPHGDASIYDALVRMAQDFSMRMPLIDGQGNFGSMDGDPPAAMRYTEARMEKVANALLEDIDRNTVDYQDNYDGSESEPKVLPARYPNLLVNGASGIAVGMATNIPPHNPIEIIDATLALIDDPETSIEGLMEHVKGPDFPTGAQILGRAGIRSAYETGRGSIIIRSKTRVEEVRKDREAIIIDETPFMVNKSRLVENIAEQVRNKKIEGISDLRDESDRDGVRVVIELKRDAVADVVLNQLFKHTPMQTHFGINMLAINAGRPMQMNLKEVLTAFISFREVVITRRTKFLLAKARDRAHLLVGLVISVANIDEVVAIIRGASNPADARQKLRDRAWDAKDVADYLDLIGNQADMPKDGTYHLSEEQIKAILELRLHRLTALGREEIGGELEELGAKIADYLDILRSRERLYSILREELVVVRDEFGNERRTEIVEGYYGDMDDEDLIQKEDMVVTVTHSGYIKRVPLSTYRAQRRGGKGRSGMSTKEEDVLTTVFVANTHTPVLFFSSRGQVYKLKVWKLPVGSPTSKGKALVNMLPLDDDESISTILPLPEDEETWGDLNVIFATSAGTVRRNSMEDFAKINVNGKIAMKLDENSSDRLVAVGLCEDGDDVLLAARGGKAIRFSVEALRVFKSRSSTGVKGMKLKDGDEVMAMSILKGQSASVEEREAYLKAAPWKTDPAKPTLSDKRMEDIAAEEDFILTVTVNGFGKRSSSHEFRAMGRGGQGVGNIATSERNGHVIANFAVEPTDQIMMVTDKGKIIRMPIDDIRVMGRGTQGVNLFTVAEGEEIVSVAKLDESDDEEDGTETNAESEDTSDTENADKSENVEAETETADKGDS